VTSLHFARVGEVASGVFVIGLLCCAGSPTSAAPITNEVMLVNTKTGKCLTIAGGVSTDNNVPSVLFDCDSEPSRRWTLTETTSGVYQIKNVQTRKCLTLVGPAVVDPILFGVQFDCDSDPSRTWRIDDVTGSAVYQLRNVQTNRCLTIAASTGDANNAQSVQSNCDADQSRRWTVRLKL
jgi:cytolethal distending toxin subunit A